MLNIIEQLSFIYLHLETWHKNKLSEVEANLYHERLLLQGNILTYVREGVLVGYLEFYRINFEQLGRVCCELQLQDTENLIDGNIALVNRMWIREDYRFTEVFNMLVAMFITKNKDAKHYITLQHHKKHKSLQNFYRKDWVRNI